MRNIYGNLNDRSFPCKILQKCSTGVILYSAISSYYLQLQTLHSPKCFLKSKFQYLFKGCKPKSIITVTNYCFINILTKTYLVIIIQSGNNMLWGRNVYYLFSDFIKESRFCTESHFKIIKNGFCSHSSITVIVIY